jgi:hypothetical protein
MSGELNYIIEELLVTFVPALAGITIGQLVLLAILALFAFHHRECKSRVVIGGKSKNVTQSVY